MAGEDSGAGGAAAPLPTLLESALPGILSRARVIVSPYPFGLGDDDNMRVTVVNSVAGAVVNVHVRRVSKDQGVTADNFVVPATSDRLPHSLDFPLSGGFVTNLTAFVSGATPQVNQTFVIIQMIRGMGGSAFVLGTLLAGPCTATLPLGWPGSAVQLPTDGPGAIRTIVGSAPLGNVQWTVTVPTNARWQLLAASAALQITGGVAAKGYGYLTFKDGGGNVFGGVGSALGSLPTDPAMSLFFMAGASGAAPPIPNADFCALPTTLDLLAGYQIVSGVGENVSDGYQWGAPTVMVREWLDF